MSHKYSFFVGSPIYPYGISVTSYKEVSHAEWATLPYTAPTLKWQFNAGDLVTAPPNPTVFTVKTRWHEMDVYEVVDSRNGFTYFIKSDELKAHRSGNCECGKEKFGFGGHTTWCPLFKENFK